jgi:site-specific DNA recombinase
MRQNITTGPIPFRKAYIKSVVDRIEVDDHAIRIIGEQVTLEQVIAGDQNAGSNVRSFARKWRAIQNKTANS